MAQDFDSSMMATRSYKKLVEAEKDYQDALMRGDQMDIAEMCYRLGKKYIGINNYYKARQWFLKSLAIREPHGPSEGIGKVYLRMGECEIYQGKSGDPDNIIRYARLAMWNFEKSGSLNGLMNGYRALAGPHLNINPDGAAYKSTFKPSIDSALHYIYKSLHISRQLNKPVDIAINYECIAQAWSLKKDFAKSVSFTEKALAIFAKEKQYYNVYSIYLELGKAYLQNKQTQQAKMWLDKAQFLGDSLKSLNYAHHAAREEVLYQYYQQTADLKNALEHQKTYYDFKVSDLDTYRKGALEGITMLHENEKKAIQLKAQQKELAANVQNMKLQIWLIVLVSLLLILAGIAGLFFYKLFRKYKKLSHENAELVMEQNHRIKNNLQSVSDLLSLQLLRLSDPVAIRALEESLLRVEAMSLVHRFLYGGDKLLEVALNKYVPDLVQSVLRSYDLEHVHVRYELEDILLHTDKAIPFGLIINELTTNACKYAFKNNPFPILEISCQYQSGEIEFTLVDNGPGIRHEPDVNSFGLKLIDLMVRNLKGVMTFVNNEGCFFKLTFAAEAHANIHQQDEVIGNI